VALEKSGISTIVVSTENDNPTLGLGTAQSALVEETADSSIDGVNLLQTSITLPRSQQRCMSLLLREVVYGPQSKLHPILREASALKNCERTNSLKGVRSCIVHNNRDLLVRIICQP